MSAAFVPAMIRLCESCATDDPSAPSLVSPKPLTNPSPIRPDARWRSMLAIRRTSRSGSKHQSPPCRAHAPHAAPGHDLVGDDLDDRTVLVGEPQAEHRLGQLGQPNRIGMSESSERRPAPSSRPSRAATRPSLITVFTRKSCRSSTRTRSARHPGATAPRSTRP